MIEHGIGKMRNKRLNILILDQIFTIDHILTFRAEGSRRGTSDGHFTQFDSARGLRDARRLRGRECQQHADSSANAHSDANPNTDADTDAHSNTDAYTDPNTNTHPDAHSHAIAAGRIS